MDLVLVFVGHYRGFKFLQRWCSTNFRLSNLKTGSAPSSLFLRARSNSAYVSLRLALMKVLPESLLLSTGSSLGICGFCMLTSSLTDCSIDAGCYWAGYYSGLFASSLLRTFKIFLRPIFGGFLSTLSLAIKLCLNALTAVESDARCNLKWALFLAINLALSSGSYKEWAGYITYFQAWGCYHTCC